MKRLAILGAIFALCAGPAHASHDTLASLTPHFDVAAFFSGRTEGIGRLKVIFRQARTVRVHGSGSIGASRELLLNQIVEQEGKPATRRTWVISALGDDRYGGSLTGATAPIRGNVSGNCLHLELKLRGGLMAEQWLYLQPGGRVALNQMSIRKMGIQVARLNETIRKID